MIIIPNYQGFGEVAVFLKILYLPPNVETVKAEFKFFCKETNDTSTDEDHFFEYNNMYWGHKVMRTIQLYDNKSPLTFKSIVNIKHIRMIDGKKMESFNNYKMYFEKNILPNPAKYGIYVCRFILITFIHEHYINIYKHTLNTEYTAKNSDKKSIGSIDMYRTL